MAVMTVLFAIIGLIIAAVVFLGWLVPLLLGLTRFRRTTAGLVLDVVGGFWGLGAMALAGLAFFAIRQMNEATRFEEFHPATYQGPVGTVAVSYRGEVEFRVIQLETGKRLRATATEGKLTLPVGNYDFRYSCDLKARGQDNRLWTATGYLSSPAFEHLAVTARTTPQLTIGPPFRAHIIARPRTADRVWLSLMVTGCDGQNYTIRTYRSNPPKFQMLSPAGEVLWQGSFAYG